MMKRVNKQSEAEVNQSPLLSIVIPTYREAKNLPVLCEEIASALASVDYCYEIIIADDDSQDGTKEVCQQLKATHPLQLLSRTTDRGLSPAVIDGMGQANGEIVVVMDADLSHPPEKIINLVDLLHSREADFVVGSRYIKGSQVDKGWPWWRYLNSLFATLPAKILVPLADPMSGFFGIRRDCLPSPESLSPIGYKIGLELLVKANIAREKVKEVPIYFRDRLHGESKMNLREQLNYLRHLRRLYHYRWPKRMELLQFIAVGASGLFIDIVVLVLLVALGVPHLVARAISYFPAVTSNWFLNRIMTFKQRRRSPPFYQWLVFVCSCGVGFVINWGTYALLTTYIGFFAEHLLFALIIGVIVATLFNFLIADKIIFRHQ